MPQPELRGSLRVTVKDEAGRVYMDIPASGVSSVQLSTAINTAIEAPPGDGPVYVFVVRGVAYSGADE